MMKGYEVVGYVSDGEFVCLGHAGNVHEDTHEPVFAGSEWNDYPICSYCPLGEGTCEDVTLSPVSDINQTEIHTWFERDRAHVDLRDKRTDNTLVEWWDDEVKEAIEDGFLNPRDYHKSAWEAFKESPKFGR